LFIVLLGGGGFTYAIRPNIRLMIKLAILNGLDGHPFDGQKRVLFGVKVLFLGVEHFGQSKVGDFYVLRRFDENVARGQVSMHNAPTLQVVHALGYLLCPNQHNVLADLVLVLLKELHNRTIFHELKDHSNGLHQTQGRQLEAILVIHASHETSFLCVSQEKINNIGFCITYYFLKKPKQPVVHYVHYFLVEFFQLVLVGARKWHELFDGHLEFLVFAVRLVEANKHLTERAAAELSFFDELRVLHKYEAAVVFWHQLVVRVVVVVARLFSARKEWLIFLGQVFVNDTRADEQCKYQADEAYG
jgi:hypothetical protein